LDTTVTAGGALAPTPITAPLVALSGTPVWTGDITMSPTAGPIAVYGNDAVPNQVSTAQFNIVGSISDQVAGSNPTLVKLGLGILILSGANTYGGETDIQEGIIIANNPNALSGVFTVVEAGTALELESSIT